MSTPTIRLATSADSDAILAIYAPYIQTPITFEEEVPTHAAFQERTNGILASHPYLVAEQDGHVIGYAYAHELRERIAYQWNAELSVYLAPAAQGHGLGSALYQALINLCAAQGIKAVYGIVTSPNTPSGAWHDVTWYVKYLTDTFEENPAAPIAFPALCVQRENDVRRILTEANERVR